MSRCKFVFICVLFVCFCSSAFSQSFTTADPAVVPLLVDKGVPLQVLLTEKLQFKEHATVHAKVIEPVYSFDREVIPVGTKIEGTVTGFRSGGKWKRVSTMLGGDFTPVRQPEIAFHTLVMETGERIPIQTIVGSGSEKIVGSNKQNGTVGKESFLSTVKKPGKEQLKSWAWGLSPYHPQYLAIGTKLTATLETQLDFGVANIDKDELAAIASEPPANSVVAVRLATPLDSRTARVGDPVEALVTRPLFSEDHKLIFPVGATLRGRVIEGTPARAFHHHGQLGFVLTTITPPAFPSASWMPSLLDSQDVETSLESVQVTHQMKDLRITASNTTKIVESKKRFIAPAWSFFRAERSIGSAADPFGTALLGAYRGKLIKQVTGGDAGFGLPASISGAMIPAVGMGFGFYGAARSVYSNFLGKGLNINLPYNTEMEVRLQKHSHEDQ